MRFSRILFGSVIFFSAFLLFLVEPLAAKQILPVLGGSSAVWITCLVFFQLMLLVGYLYAHWLTHRFSRAAQRNIHIAMLAIAFALLMVQSHLHPGMQSAAAHPVAAIFILLMASIGLPFFLLASTSPLLQVWLSWQQQNRIPYRLFALSNAGSLLALIAYPTLVEPYLSLRHQWTIWSVGFACYAILGFILARKMYASAPVTVPAPADEAIGETETSSRRQRWLWFLLPMAAAMQLSAVTEHLTQNIAAIPLLWILPLAVYLLSFILAFDAPSLYRRWIVVRLLVVMLASLGYMLTKTDMTLAIGISILFFLLEVFVACYFCHAEVCALRPRRASEATRFYLLLAAGGVAGTFFIGIVCPYLFAANYDTAIAFAVTAALALAVTWRDGWAQRLLWSTGTILLCVLLGMLHIAYARQSLIEMRSFYGSLRVTQTNSPPQAQTVRTLLNGAVQHGIQWFGPEFHRRPTTYYAEDSGAGLALEHCCAGRPRNIGVVGLGAGTLAAYGQPGDRFRFYEINPEVITIAQHLFTYLRDSPAQVSIADGDARISLTQESSQHFDVLVVDAFSGDAIPVHLLTREAMALYQRHLAPGGIVAFHISNQFLNLAPEVALLASSANMQSRIIDSPADSARGELAASWVLVSNNMDFFQQPEIASVARSIPAESGLQLWTDDYSSLLPIMKWLGH
ncbi:fused MFS/spermidine synthase [Granulicella sp. S156]|uniref:fused MFS/spermidine synthase n=1 Tax=Granulicella sp. S156 TaxID=1747224 RepID=UPI00131B4D9D|nr:fused MFS/spermidine synthase [Granulicella sp. S156]